MVSAINFAVRDSAGSAQLSTIAGEAQSNVIVMGAAQHISLNISPGTVVAYVQQGNDFLVQMTDGRTIILSNYFAAPLGQENKLFLSSNDEIVEVRVNGGVDGVLFADYGPMEALDKWSPLDDLRFSQADVLDDVIASNEPAGMAMLVPGLLAGGGAGLGGLGAAAALAGCQRQSKIGPKGSAKCCHFGVGASGDPAQNTVRIQERKSGWAAGCCDSVCRARA
jgi:large repetitive protein